MFETKSYLDDMLSGGGCKLAVITCNKCAWESSANSFHPHQPSSVASGQRSDEFNMHEECNTT